MARPCAQSEASNKIPEWMILGSFRYAIGRMTYQVEETTAWLISNWDTLSENLQETIKKELDEELKRDAKAREQRREHLPLGMDCDRAEWVRLWCVAGNHNIQRT